MFKDIIGLLIVAGIVYNALTGRVDSGGYARRKENPFIFWILMPVSICIAVVLLWLVLYDFYHRLG
jgi:hypothetical protein